ncbi:uncharacterized mitochondrial protein-like protein [Tanacetum coccineum]
MTTRCSYLPLLTVTSINKHHIPPAKLSHARLCTDPPPHAPSVASPTHTDQPPPSPHVAALQAPHQLHQLSSLQGSLWASKSSAKGSVSQFLHAPMQDHFQAVKRILRYVKGTLSYGISFLHAPSPTILGYSDADWARCIETRRSTYGYSIFLGGNLVSWSAKKQPTVSRSSCESEYRALANTASEIVWITHLLRELHVLPSGRPTLLCDNRSALFLSQNPISHKRAKHIDIDYHFVRELVLSGKLHTRYVSTHLQLADIFTKSLPRPLFEEFRSKLRVGPPPLRLRGVRILKPNNGNFVSLIGYCNDGKDMCLVYECMPNGTLDDHLHKDDTRTELSWPQRLKICDEYAHLLSKHLTAGYEKDASWRAACVNWSLIYSPYGSCPAITQYTSPSSIKIFLL